MCLILCVCLYIYIYIYIYSNNVLLSSSLPLKKNTSNLLLIEQVVLLNFQISDDILLLNKQKTFSIELLWSIYIIAILLVYTNDDFAYCSHKSLYITTRKMGFYNTKT